MKTSIAALLLGLAASAPGAFAAGPEQACVDCHEGSSTRGHPPRISGQRAAYLEAALRDFDGEARDGFPMDAVAHSLDAATRAQVARALSLRPWVPPPAATAAPVASTRVDALRCGRCHGSGFNGRGAVPRLAGQDPVYLERRIRTLLAEPHPAGKPSALRFELAAEEPAALAAWFSAVGMPPRPTR